LHGSRLFANGSQFLSVKSATTKQGMRSGVSGQRAQNLDLRTQRCWLHSCRPIHAETGMADAGVEAHGELEIFSFLPVPGNCHMWQWKARFTVWRKLESSDKDPTCQRAKTLRDPSCGQTQHRPPAPLPNPSSTFYTAGR